MHVLQQAGSSTEFMLRAYKSNSKSTDSKHLSI